MPATHCLRLDRHFPHEEVWRTRTWGARYFQCNGLPVVEGGAEQAERCEDCNKRLLPDNRATTCAVHLLCSDCEPHRADTCSSCHYYKAMGR